MAVVWSDKVKDVVEMVANGYKKLLSYASATPASDTLEFIEYLEDFDDLDDSELIESLATWAGLSYDDFKRVWDGLYDSEKNEALDAIEYRMALAGFEEFLRRIAYEPDIRRDWDLGKKIINLAKKYVRGKIDIYEFGDDLVDLFWGTEEGSKLEDNKFSRNFADAVTLMINYIDEETVKELVKKYLIDELEAPWI